MYENMIILYTKVTSTRHDWHSQKNVYCTRTTKAHSQQQKYYKKEDKYINFALYLTFMANYFYNSIK